MKARTSTPVRHPSPRNPRHGAGATPRRSADVFRTATVLVAFVVLVIGRTPSSLVYISTVVVGEARFIGRRSPGEGTNVLDRRCRTVPYGAGHAGPVTEGASPG
ncbi:hypothetical protein GCM10017559_04160 [Streptosporangium longisporum]|uniref:Uncharacterized protein n=1 Tax=Streptosporangium longisporum TaxID=46187 RepID=A0ABN3XQP2_9ACTN